VLHWGFKFETRISKSKTSPNNRSSKFRFRVSSTIATNCLGRRSFVRVFRADRERDSATRRKLRSNSGFTRRTGFDEIVQNPVRHGFIEGAIVAIRCQIKLERLALDAKPIWHIIDVDPGKIRLTGDRTEAREIVGLKVNVIMSARRIWKCLEPCLGRRCR
jgi:hypothetical protein